VISSSIEPLRWQDDRLTEISETHARIREIVRRVRTQQHIGALQVKVHNVCTRQSFDSTCNSFENVNVECGIVGIPISTFDIELVVFACVAPVEKRLFALRHHDHEPATSRTDSRARVETIIK
jgi:hypothetical protein